MDVSDILTEYDDHGFSDVSTTRKMEILNETYFDVCGREPWKFLEKSVTFTFDGINQPPTNIPTDFGAVLKMYNPANGTTVRPWRLDDFIEELSSALSLIGLPYIYYWEGTGVKLFPTPYSDTTIVAKYVSNPPKLLSTDVEASILIPKRFHRGLLVNGALEKLYAMEDDTDLAAWFERKYEKAMNYMRKNLWILSYDETDFIHPVDDDNY